MQEEREFTLGAAIWVVRETARFNMVTEAGDVWTAAMCVAAAWGRADVVDWVNALDREWGAEYQRCYLQGGDRARWQAAAESSPFGCGFCDAAGRHGAGEATKSLGAFREHHRLGWANALVARAEESCYAAGLRARDVAQLEAARGVTEPYLLKAVGAQLVARRSCVTELPTA